MVHRLRTLCCSNLHDAFRVGPVVTLLMGVALHFLGYFGLWWAARGVFMPPYWVLVMIAFFTCNAQTFMETGSLVTSIRNFDTER